MDLFTFLKGLLNIIVPLVQLCSQGAHRKAGSGPIAPGTTAAGVAGSDAFGLGALDAYMTQQLNESTMQMQVLNAYANQQLAESMQQTAALNQLMWTQGWW